MLSSGLCLTGKSLRLNIHKLSTRTLVSFKVSDLVRKLNQEEVFTMSHNLTLNEAAQFLDSRKIGASLVKDGNNNISGIISERDICHALSRHSSNFNTLIVDNIKTPVNELRSVTMQDNLLDVSNLMISSNFRHLPVMSKDNKKPIAMLSIKDVVGTVLQEQTEESKHYDNIIHGTY